GHELFDVHENQHALADGPDTRQVFGGEGGAELRRGTDLRALQHQDVRHAVHDDADHAGTEVQDHDHRLVVVFNVLEVELDAHVDDRNDDTAQIGHALHERRHVRNAGHRLAVVAADFLDFQNIDTVFLGSQREDQVFLAGRFGHCGLGISEVGHGGSPEFSWSIRLRGAGPAKSA